MPIKVQSDLPARQILETENIFVMDENRAMHQDIRPLKVLILNNMPVKQDTELQLLRALSNTPLQVDVTFMMTSTHVSHNTSASHLNKFYVTFDDIKDQNFDGMIITGAPVEEISFEEVDYWDETVKILDWADKHVTSIFHICNNIDTRHLNILKYPDNPREDMRDIYWVFKNIEMPCVNVVKYPVNISHIFSRIVWV